MSYRTLFLAATAGLLMLSAPGFADDANSAGCANPIKIASCSGCTIVCTEDTVAPGSYSGPAHSTGTTGGTDTTTVKRYTGHDLTHKTCKSTGGTISYKYICPPITAKSTRHSGGNFGYTDYGTTDDIGNTSPIDNGDGGN